MNKKCFKWHTSIEVDYGPRINGQRMSLSDAEIILDALDVHRQKAVDQLEELLNKRFVDLHQEQSEFILTTFREACTEELEVIKCCDFYKSMLTSSGMAAIRMIAAQYPQLADKDTDE